MKLHQKRGSEYDSIAIEDDRLVHSWSLSREKGERKTLLSNIDPEFGYIEKKTEGKLPYFTLGLFFLLLLYFYNPESGWVPGVVIACIFLMLAVVFLGIGMVRRRKENITEVYLKDGSVFARIRHDWVKDEEREMFLKELKGKITVDF